jgi:predicted NUDIX family NTP pyrophosphohydrolase
MGRTSAGLLLFRTTRGAPDAVNPHGVQVLLVHPGGPYWRHKDAGAWSIPKGEIHEGEDPLTAAVREFMEETGQPAPKGELIPLGSVRQKGGKTVTAWAASGDCDAGACRSNLMRMEYPPRSGRWIEFPEADRAEWFCLKEAAMRINSAQTAFLDRLAAALAHPCEECANR